MVWTRPKYVFNTAIYICYMLSIGVWGHLEVFVLIGSHQIQRMSTTHNPATERYIESSVGRLFSGDSCILHLVPFNFTHKAPPIIKNIHLSPPTPTSHAAPITSHIAHHNRSQP
jgi:hypothetical protein